MVLQEKRNESKTIATPYFDLKAIKAVTFFIDRCMSRRKCHGRCLYKSS